MNGSELWTNRPQWATMRIVNARMLIVPALLLMVLAGGCGGSSELDPEPTAARYYRNQWAVVETEYTPAYRRPDSDSERITLLRSGEAFRIVDADAAFARVAGERGRWYQLSIPEVGEGWLFSTHFSGFHTSGQARRYAKQMSSTDNFQSDD